MTTKRPDIAVYYFPNYHRDSRNWRQHGAEWTEWDLVRKAKPRFAGHQQPKIPAWGYEDEANPQVMAKKIDAAADHGINTFLFDWYWYNDGPFLHRALDEGFLQAPNNSRLKFALMWANHDWCNVHPLKAFDGICRPGELCYPGPVTPETFEKIIDICIQRYFQHPSYWQVDGCPYFSIYELTKLLAGFGGLSEARDLLEHFRKKVKQHGFKDIHLNAIVWNNPILPGETGPIDPVTLVNELGFDSVTSYVWIHHFETDEFPSVDYNRVRDAYFAYWDRMQDAYKCPYFPNVTVGWDASPRTDPSGSYGNYGYPFMYLLENSTPENFKNALSMVKQKLTGHPVPCITINAWNEWTEGSYLEPDSMNGLKYLEAIQGVFGGNSVSEQNATQRRSAQKEEMLQV